MNFRTREDGHIEPCNEGNMPLFSHCSEGMIAVKFSYLVENTLPLIDMHDYGKRSVHRLDGKEIV